MLRLRLLLLLAGCLVLASAALADDIGYVDCSSHPDGSQIYGKARQSTDVVGSVPCGERFIVLLYGFIFSRIQTADNKVGYVLSSMISIDHSVAVLQRTQRPAAAVTASAAPVTPAPAPVSQPATAASVQVQSPPAQTAQAPAEITLQSAPASAGNAAAAALPAPAQVNSQPAASTTAPASTLPQSAAMVTQASSTPVTDPQSAAVQPASAPATSASTPPSDAAPRTPEPPAPVTQPTPPAAAQPDPAPAQPAPAQPSAAQPPASQPPDPQPVEPIRDTSARASWEQPRPAGRNNNLLDLYGGFAFARYNATSSASATNLVGGLGAFGYNFKSWLQITGDSSFNYYNSNGYKYVLYGNHYGVRYFYRRHHFFGITPFAEGLVGGSRLDTTYSGTKTSTNCISYKVGGGLDVHPTRHLEIRLLDADYYRTSFGTNTTQTSYWVTAGIVLRLFGSNRPY